MSETAPAAPAAPAPAPAAPVAPPEQRLVGGEALTPEQVLALPLFEGFSKSKLEKNPGTIVRRRYRAGETICREGDFGSTAFLLLEGKADVFLQSRIGHIANRGGARGLFRKLKSFLTRESDAVRGEPGRRFIPIDAPVDLDMEKPTAELGPGDLFGEMACLSFYPRSATVRAKSDCVAVEMLRNILTELQRNPKFRAVLEEKYRTRALDQHLESVPLLRGLSREFVDRLRPKIKLLRFDPGQVIFKQGDAPDGFYLVRIGFVKVSRSHAGGDVVLSYLPRGSCFGEMALLSDAPRSATCAALDHVEVVKIESDDFKSMLQEFPSIRERIATLAGERERQNAALAARAASVNLEEFLAQGLMEAQNLLLLDLDRCTRCDECVHGCASAHGGVTRLIRDGLRFDHYLVATSCRTCRDPLCMVGCPVGAIRRKESLEIVIEDWCIGCNLCAKQCPYGNINMVELAEPASAAEPAAAHAGGEAKPQKAQLKKKATTCDLCMDHGEPACVSSCPHDAAHRVDPIEFFARGQFFGGGPGGPGGSSR